MELQVPYRMCAKISKTNNLRKDKERHRRSPRKILINCGSSSKLVARIIFPIRVTRASPFSEYTPLPCASALTHIDLNFNSVNSFPLSPRRTCLKKAGPRESSLITNAIISIGKAKTTTPIKANTTSINRLKKCLYIFVETNFQTKNHIICII